jgi:membrane-bound metal-dependent hydrolase YbcI (DUF457 family)
MASPIAHSLAGASIYFLSVPAGHWREQFRQHWRLITFFAILGNLPDADFILGWLTTGDPNEYHHGWTHSIALAIGAAALTALVIKIRPGFAANWCWFFAAISSHLLIDFFTGPSLGIQRGYGMPLLWPFTQEMLQAPISLVVGPQHHELQHLLSWHNWVWGAYEAVVFGLLFWLVIHRSDGKRSRRLPG